MSKSEFETRAQFRHQMCRFLCFSEEVTRRNGIVTLQYHMMFQIKGFPSREWATTVEFAEHLQARHHSVMVLISRCEKVGLVVPSTSRDEMRLAIVAKTPNALAPVWTIRALPRHAGKCESYE